MNQLILLDTEERHIDISEDVVAEVVMHTLDQLENISYAGGRRGINQWLSRNKENLKGIEAGDEITFDVQIKVPYGENITANCQRVQAKLVEQFRAFFDVANVKFDILVEGFSNISKKQ